MALIGQFLGLFSLVGVLFVISTSESLERFTNAANCGVPSVSNSASLARIVNGTESVLGQWPWQAMIVVERDGASFIVCGGTLVNNRGVVTAAHCFQSGDTAATVSVYLGVLEKDRLDQSSQLSLRNMTCHEGFDGDMNDFTDDICVLELSSNVTYTDYIRPACMPGQDTATSSGTMCVISGWGETRNTGDDNVLRYAEVPVVARDTCVMWYQEGGISIPEKHICAGYENGGIDACQGDSGGPLVCAEMISGTNTYVLQGITSFGADCALARRPGVYTAVAEYVDWIDGVIGDFSDSAHSMKSGMVLFCAFFWCFAYLVDAAS